MLTFQWFWLQAKAKVALISSLGLFFYGSPSEQQQETLYNIKQLSQFE